MDYTWMCITLHLRGYVLASAETSTGRIGRNARLGCSTRGQAVAADESQCMFAVAGSHEHAWAAAGPASTQQVSQAEVLMKDRAKLGCT